MVWFWKKKQDEQQRDDFSDLPPLPPLPEDQGFPSQSDAEGQGYDSQQLPPLPPLPALPQLPSVQGQQTQMQLPQPQFQQFSYPPISVSAPTAATPEGATATVFVRLDKYKDIMHTIDNIQMKLEELQHSLAKISSIKQKEAEIIQGWGALMTESKEKIDQLNRKLLKPGEQ